jgi:hypothetical protein
VPISFGLCTSCRSPSWSSKDVAVLQLAPNVPKRLVTKRDKLSSDALTLLLDQFQYYLLYSVGLIEVYNFAEDHNSIGAAVSELLKLTASEHLQKHVFSRLASFFSAYFLGRHGRSSFHQV